MLDYRAYFIGRDGHTGGVFLFTAETDDEAQEITFSAARGRAYELWCGDRLVVEVPRRPL